MYLVVQEDGHHPARIVLSRSMDLPENANLWDVSHAPTIVCTQKGARKDFQNTLIARGVEVVEFEFLSPRCVMEYCAQRGFLQVSAFISLSSVSISSVSSSAV